MGTYVAAFAISAYGYCTARASHKPFNPLLGETYECVREDKGFRYIAEQVSHHPPVSCAQATGADWCWSQALRIRSKSWAKSAGSTCTASASSPAPSPGSRPGSSL